MNSRPLVSLDEWFQIEKERRRETDRMRVIDLARRLRARAAEKNRQNPTGR